MAGYEASLGVILSPLRLYTIYILQPLNHSLVLEQNEFVQSLEK